MSSAKEELKKDKKEEKKIDKIKNPGKVANKKKKIAIISVLLVIVIIVLIMIFSVIFAFMQKDKTTIVNGIQINKIDVSGLNVNEAKEKIINSINKNLETPVNLNYEDYNLSVNPSEIEFAYKIDEILTEAYSIGRNENLVKSNYEIIETKLFGKEYEIAYNYNEDSLKKIIEKVDAEIPGKVTQATYCIEENELIITPGKDGIVVNAEKLTNNLLEMMYTSKEDNSKNITIPIENKSAEPIDVEKIYSEIYCEPQDARLEKEPFKLVKDENGINFAITIDEAKALITGDKEEYTIPLKITPANIKVSDLGDEAFPSSIATFSTLYDAGYTARSTNLRLAANKINGMVLLPGEVFSFNKVVGKRTVEDGYQNAPIYENGKVVDGLAGGICQISSTLYNAVLLANLEIVERRNHNFTSTYVPAGRDATVVYGAIDFKFKNNRTYPIKIIASVSGGTARFELKGIKEETEYDVKIYTQTIATMPVQVETIEDPTMAAGTEVVTQAGHNGSKVNSYRALILNGKEVSREFLGTDTYQVMKRVVKVGTAVAEPVVAPVVEPEPVVDPAPVQTSTPEPVQAPVVDSTPVQTPVQNTTSETNTTPSTSTTDGTQASSQNLASTNQTEQNGVN